MTGRHGDYIASGSADLSMRCGECPDDDACEELRAFEVSFAIPITMTQDYQRRLLDLLSELVAEPHDERARLWLDERARPRQRRAEDQVVQDVRRQGRRGVRQRLAFALHRGLPRLLNPHRGDLKR